MFSYLDMLSLRFLVAGCILSSLKLRMTISSKETFIFLIFFLGDGEDGALSGKLISDNLIYSIEGIIFRPFAN